MLVKTIKASRKLGLHISFRAAKVGRVTSGKLGHFLHFILFYCKFETLKLGAPLYLKEKVQWDTLFGRVGQHYIKLGTNLLKTSKH